MVHLERVKKRPCEREAIRKKNLIDALKWRQGGGEALWNEYCGRFSLRF